MLEISSDELPLAEAAPLIEELRLPQQYREPTAAERERFPSIGEAWDERPYWARYLDDKVTTYQWTDDGADVWLAADAKTGVLRRVVIKGLNGKEEAEALRAECHRVRIQTGRRLTSEDIHRIAEEFFNPIGYPHQRVFASALRNIRSHFKWENREAIEGEGWILPISRLKLPTEDVELLREVFRRLPPIGGAVQVSDGRTPARQSAAKSLKTARERVKKLGGEFADEGFVAWVDECLQTKTDRWSRSRDPLYLHYKAWIRKGGHGQNMGERAEAKATALSEVKWGMLMRRRFPNAWKQDKHTILYQVTLKRGA